MKRQRIALIFAACFFAVWLVVLYAGADHPLPWSFFWVFPFNALGAWIVYVRTSLYIQWYSSRRKNRVFRVLLEGMIVGLIFAFLVRLVPGTGEPSIRPPGPVEIMIWFGVVAALGAVNSCAIYFFGAMCSRALGTRPEEL